MKKSSLIIGLLFITGLTLGSCKREYVCECSKTYTGEGGSTTEDYAKYTYKDDRVGAEEKCNAKEKTDSDVFGEYTVNCSIDD